MTAVPTDAKAFAAWRKQETFATPELARKARFVESDLKLLTKLFPRHAETYAVIRKNLEEFVAAYSASKAGGG